MVTKQECCVYVCVCIEREDVSYHSHTYIALLQLFIIHHRVSVLVLFIDLVTSRPGHWSFLGTFWVVTLSSPTPSSGGRLTDWLLSRHLEGLWRIY